VDAIIDKFARGIARAEGFYVKNSRPARNHNPGDLTADTIGKGVGWDGAYVIYPDDETGWAALRRQVALFFSGSRYYDAEMTIWEVAKLYTSTDQVAWANTVAKELGVSVTTKLSEISA